MENVVDLKIKTDKDPQTGENRVPPEVMRLLMEHAAHRQVCDECQLAFENKTGLYCKVGQILMDDIVNQPEVEVVRGGSK